MDNQPLKASSVMSPPKMGMPPVVVVMVVVLVVIVVVVRVLEVVVDVVVVDGVVVADDVFDELLRTGTSMMLTSSTIDACVSATPFNTKGATRARRQSGECWARWPIFHQTAAVSTPEHNA